VNQSGPNVTAEDVARKLGVSQSTISRAFSTSASISPQMRERVLEAARKLGYQPNVIARSLITRRTKIVAIVMANLVDPFYPVILDALTQAIQARGRQTLLFVPPDEGSLDETLTTLLQYQVDAIIIASATVSSRMVGVCASRATPLILFNRYVPGLKVAAVSCDNVASSREVADHLARTGHRRVAYVAGEPDATTNIDRRNGFVERWTALGLGAVIEVPGGAYSFEAGFAAAQQLARLPEIPDAIFFASDILAIGGLHALRDERIAVPDEISVIGFDDVPLTAWPAFDLTTVRQPIPEMVEIALDSLGLDNPAARTTPRVRFVPGQLVERGTSRERKRSGNRLDCPPGVGYLKEMRLE
jgi:DNA-binding LacI/PurR family transcriptional regulator